jgi:hypothetical protein
MKLKLEIPETCRNCPYLKNETVDHNYYGEKTETTLCMLFNAKISDFSPCGECLAKREESEDDIEKYADFLVREINAMISEIYNKTLDKVLLKGVDAVKYLQNGVAIITFSDFKELLDNLRKQ